MIGNYLAIFKSGLD